jgi:DNA-binding MarR family transcriptional regulator
MSKRHKPRQDRDTAETIATECVGARVRMLNRAVTRIYDDELRSHGIKFSQMNILTIVALRGPVQAVEVARTLSLEKSTVSRNLTILEAKGWIQSVAGDVGNTRQLHATRQGQRLLSAAEPAWQSAQDQVIALLGERTSVALRRAADRLQQRETL